MRLRPDGDNTQRRISFGVLALVASGLVVVALSWLTPAFKGHDEDPLEDANHATSAAGRKARSQPRGAPTNVVSGIIVGSSGETRAGRYCWHPRTTAPVNTDDTIVNSALARATCAATEPDGTFAFTLDAAQTAIMVYALVPAHLPVAIIAQREAEQDWPFLKITLESTSVQVRGEVIDALGGSAEGALVSFSPWHDRLMGGPYFGFTDVDGKFTIMIPRDAEGGSLHAHMEGYAAGEQRFIGVAHYHTIRLLPASTITGAVVLVDGEKRTVPGARVALQSWTPAGLRPVATSESQRDGTFAFTDLPPGRYRLDASKDGRASSGRDVRLSGPATVVDDVELVLRDGFRIEGRVVVGNHDTPCLHSRATLNRLDGLLKREIEVDGAELAFEGLETGRYAIEASCDGQPRQNQPAVYDLRQDIVGEVWRVSRSYAIRGRVVEHGADRLEDRAKVYLRVESTDTRPSHQETTSDVDGTFSIEGVGTGTYTLFAETTRSAAPFEGVEIVVQDEDVTGLVLEVFPLPSIRGSVTGQDLRWTTVIAQRTDHEAAWTALLGEDRTFEFPGLRPGLYEVYAADPWGRYAPEAEKAATLVDVERGVTELVLQPPRVVTAVLDGFVLDASGHPHGDTPVEAKGTSRLRAFRNGTYTDERGYFNFGEVPRDETFDLRVTAQTGARSRVGGIEPGTPVRITLVEGGSLEAEVLGGNQPLSGPRTARLELRGPSVGHRIEEVTISNGRFTVSNVPAGSITAALRLGASNAEAETTVEPEGVGALRFVLDGTAD